MPFLKSVSLQESGERYPFSIPSIGGLFGERLELHPKVTFFVGENGSGKSTLLEGIADKLGFAAQSGNRSQNLQVRSYETALAPALTISKTIGIRPMDGFISYRWTKYMAIPKPLRPYSANSLFEYRGLKRKKS